jgi:hypothetical protein
MCTNDLNHSSYREQIENKEILTVVTKGKLVLTKTSLLPLEIF